MAIRQGRATSGQRRRGFYQTEMMNAQLPQLQTVLAQQEQRRQREQDVAFRTKQFRFEKQAQKDQRAAQQKAQRTQMGLEAAKMGVTLGSMGGDKTFGGIFNMAPGKEGAAGSAKNMFAGLNVPATIGAGLTGFGIGNMFDKKGLKFGMGALGGGLVGLLGAGAGGGLAGGLSGGLMGGLGGLASSLFK